MRAWYSSGLTQWNVEMEQSVAGALACFAHVVREPFAEAVIDIRMFGDGIDRPERALRRSSNDGRPNQW